MGNEESRYCKLEIEEEAIEVTDNWSLHYARNVDGNASLHSAFIGQPRLSQKNSTSLERFAKVIPCKFYTFTNFLCVFGTFNYLYNIFRI